jgi:hypothetical protein
MSDQCPDLQNTQIAGAGGAGIVSINGDAVPAQTISAGAGIGVVHTGPGSNRIDNLGVLDIRCGGVGIIPGNPVDFISSPAISVANVGLNQILFTLNPGVVGVSSIKANGGGPRLGDIVFLDGVGVTIVEGPVNTFTINAAVSAGVSTLGLVGLPRTGPIVLVPGANITIVEGPNGTFTFDTGAAAGIVSLNADAGAAQTLAGVGPVVVHDLGAGAHTIEVPDFAPASSGLVPNPNTIPLSANAKLFPSGWKEQDRGFATSNYPGNNQSLFTGVSVSLANTTTIANNRVVIVGSMQCTNPVAAIPGAYIAVTIRIGGTNVRTMQIPVNNFVPPYISVTHIGQVIAGQLVELVFFNSTGETLFSRGYNLDVVGVALV